MLRFSCPIAQFPVSEDSDHWVEVVAILFLFDEPPFYYTVGGVVMQIQEQHAIYITSLSCSLCVGRYDVTLLFLMRKRELEWKGVCGEKGGKYDGEFKCFGDEMSIGFVTKSAGWFRVVVGIEIGKKKY